MLGHSTRFWKYWLHLPFEKLVGAVGFNEPLRALVAASERGWTKFLIVEK